MIIVSASYIIAILIISNLEILCNRLRKILENGCRFLQFKVITMTKLRSGIIIINYLKHIQLNKIKKASNREKLQVSSITCLLR